MSDSSLPPLLVIRKTSNGWDGTVPFPEDVPVHPQISGCNPFYIEYDFDAHCVAYFVPGTHKAPRVKMGAERVAGVVKAWMIVDIDTHDQPEFVNQVAAELSKEKDDRKKIPWTLEKQQITLSKLATLPEFHHCGWYFTKHGMRLVWPLAETQDVLTSASWARQFLLYIEETTTVKCDDKCVDWTHIFRMPDVLRDGERQTHPEDYARMLPLSWTAPLPLETEKERVLSNFEHSAIPKGVSKPGKRDYVDFKKSEYYQRVVDGVALAPDGERNNATIRCLGQMIVYLDIRDPYIAYRLMYRNIKAQLKEGSKRGLDWFWGRCQEFVSKHKTEQEELEEWTFNKETEDKERFLSLVERAAVAIGVPPNEVRQHLILVSKGKAVYYVFHTDKMSYGPGVQENMLIQQLSRYCTELTGDIVGPRGGLPATKELLLHFGTQIEGVEVVYGVDRVHYDVRRRMMIEGAGGILPIEPEYNAEIEKWLQLLGGDNIKYLLDWLTTLFRYEDPTCALYIMGGNSSGKGMLAEALGEFWERPLTDYATLSANFSQDILNCPIVWADEKIPRNNASAAFRKILGSSRFQVTRKGLGNAILKGCPRIIVTANNNDALSLREALTPKDLKAIARRIGYLEVSNECRDYLTALGGRQYTKKWVAGGGIVRHILWLMETRTVEFGDRYLVEGWESEFATNLVTMSGSAGNITVAIANMLGTPGKMGEFNLCHAQNGGIFINAPEFQRHWRDLSPGSKFVPEEYEITDALRSISLDKIRIRRNGNRINVWSIDPKFIYAVSERQHLYPVEELEKIINQKVNESKADLSLTPPLRQASIAPQPAKESHP